MEVIRFELLVNKSFGMELDRVLTCVPATTSRESKNSSNIILSFFVEGNIALTARSRIIGYWE